MLAYLARRAGLPRRPAVYVLPSHEVNAFAAGKPRDAAVAVTHGLLNELNRREMAGVLAHEISHLTHRDLFVMRLAGLVHAMTRSLSTLGQLLLILQLPLLLVGGYGLPLLPILILLLAPVVVAMFSEKTSFLRFFYGPCKYLYSQI